MNIMFDQSFRVVKEEFPIPLKHKDVIYVFEDVDAASRIVKSRKGSKKKAGALPYSPKEEEEEEGGAGAGNEDDDGKKNGGGGGGDDDEYGNEFDKLDLSVSSDLKKQNVLVSSPFLVSPLSLFTVLLLAFVVIALLLFSVILA